MILEDKKTTQGCSAGRDFQAATKPHPVWSYYKYLFGREIIETQLWPAKHYDLFVLKQIGYRGV